MIPEDEASSQTECMDVKCEASWCLPVWPWWAPLWCPAKRPRPPRWHQAQWRSPPSWLRAGYWPERTGSLTWGWPGWPALPLKASQCSSADAAGATAPPAGHSTQLNFFLLIFTLMQCTHKKSCCFFSYKRTLFSTVYRKWATLVMSSAQTKGPVTENKEKKWTKTSA